VKISAIPDVMNDFERGTLTWFSEPKRWGFRIPGLVQIRGVGQRGDNFSLYANLGGPPFPIIQYHWVVAQDMAPLIAVAEYEKKGVPDLNTSGQGYCFRPEISCVVSGNEIGEIFERQATGKDVGGIYPMYSPQKTNFITMDKIGKNPTFFINMDTGFRSTRRSAWTN
jgi:hypothetical protein